MLIHRATRPSSNPSLSARFPNRNNVNTFSGGYDAASRLNALTQDLAGSGQDLNRSFTHNNAGQIRTRNTVGNTYEWATSLANKTYAADGLNRYATVSGTSISYDLNGNLTSDGTRTFSYDVENRLIRVTQGGVQTDLSYDPLGRLKSTVTGTNTTEFLYDGDRLVAEYNGASVLQRRYVHGPGVDEPVVWYEGANFVTSPDRRWLHADERGSIIATSDASGNSAVYTYGPYGEPASRSGSRFRYTGQIALPEVQLYHYKARVYDPILGRFLQTDPIGYKDDANLYAYARNDPINNSDPTGTICTGGVRGVKASCKVDYFDGIPIAAARARGLISTAMETKIARYEANRTKAFEKAIKFGSLKISLNAYPNAPTKEISGTEISTSMRAEQVNVETRPNRCPTDPVNRTQYQGGQSVAGYAAAYLQDSFRPNFDIHASDVTTINSYGLTVSDYWQKQEAIHETIHHYTGMYGNEGYHQNSFRQAIDQILNLP